MLPLFLIYCMTIASAQPTAEELMVAIDKNMNYSSRTSTIRMTVVKGRRTKTYEMQSKGRGRDEAAIEFLSPTRDKGTKMLKKGGDLWMYLPSIERSQKISGHMLRKGMMGSDMSYEDMMNSTQLLSLYSAKVIGLDVVDDRECYRMELMALSPETTYAKRESCIDTVFLVPLEEKLYGTSGMLIKEWHMREIQDFNGRNFPTNMVVEDKLLEGSITTIEFLSLDFSTQLDDSVFNKRWLER